MCVRVGVYVWYVWYCFVVAVVLCCCLLLLLAAFVGCVVVTAVVADIVPTSAGSAPTEIWKFTQLERDAAKVASPARSSSDIAGKGLRVGVQLVWPTSWRFAGLSPRACVTRAKC